MRKIKITMMVLLCILTAGLCGILVYGMTGHSIYKTEYVYRSSKLVLEKEVSTDGVDRISVTYDMNSNDIRIYEKEGSTLTVKEYSPLELAQQEISTVEVNGSHIEVVGKKRNRNNHIQFGLVYDGQAGNYTEIGLPSSKMDIAAEKAVQAATSSGDLCIPNITAQDVSLECSSGDVQVGKVSTEHGSSTGDIVIKTTSGEIKTDQLTGTVITETSSGDITVGQVTGDAHIKTNSGSIQSESILGNVQVAASSGDISVQRIDGNVTAESSSGDIKIYEGSGRRMVSTTSGEIVLSQVAAAWEAESSSGDVTIKAQEGSGSIHTTSGDIHLDLDKLTGNLTLESSSGSAAIRISQDNAFAFKADTSNGDIDTFFDDKLDFSKKGNSAKGVYGTKDTGSQIVVRTTSGDVRVTN